ncbi:MULTISPECIES: GNAT family N-acetyltransferase [unclassified Streptomyces]|uniref:GNAT family N-acetyltransferase n=1 Tax=unclassified Streptomyces TaxID=2593676 RepID=UPI00225191C2|nr:GNAT family N-acetyltransferase [Streptomyces sp. NBC_00555]MCX5012671.1 GNAT family N-acetyltransferase [Streptomyces sp. NBC_00555]
MTLPHLISLLPYRPAEDAPLLRTWVTTRTELITWAGPAFSWPLDDAQLAAYAADPGRHIWTAVSPGNHRVGHVSVSGTRLGRVLIAPEARDQGLGRALVSQAVELCFGELALPEITLGVWAHNTAALRIYEKLGFRTEEILEGVEEVDGVPWTAVQMRLTAPDR